MLYEALSFVFGVCVAGGMLLAYIKGTKSAVKRDKPKIMPFFTPKGVRASISAEEMILHNIDNPKTQYSNEEIEAARGRVK
ncbi:MAG: hypothetical protein RR573_02615 [Oscillospiraceae bacterium]